MDTPPAFPFAGCNIGVWILPVTVSEPLAARAELALDEEERVRASRYAFEKDRRSFVIARCVLRCVLGRYLGRHPASVRFHFGPNGKPSVESKKRLEFSVTHSAGLSVVAFTEGGQIGVDLEKVRPIEDWQLIAKRFFCREELAELEALPASQREEAFFRCWTRKEAYLKATGEGLSAPLDRFQVTLRPEDPPSFIHLSGDREAAKLWTLEDIATAPGFVAALAYRGPRRAVSVFQPEVDFLRGLLTD